MSRSLIAARGFKSLLLRWICIPRINYWKSSWQIGKNVVWCKSCCGPDKTESNKINQKVLDKQRTEWYNRKASYTQKRITEHWQLNNKTTLKIQLNFSDDFSKNRRTFFKNSNNKDKEASASWTWIQTITWEFDPGSGWTLAACLTHASRTKLDFRFFRNDEWYDWVADGWVTRGQPASYRGITVRNDC